MSKDMHSDPASPSRLAAEAFAPGSYIAEELEARGWTASDLAIRMGGATIEEMAKDQLVVELFIAVHDPKLVLDTATARKLAEAFGTSTMLWLNLDAGYRWACAQGRGAAIPHSEEAKP
jgi:HTH-type transcriptional regulator/antitoxin HigA